MDLNGSLKSLPKEGGFYENSKKRSKEIDASWPKENVEVKAESSVEKNEFQSDLDKGVCLADMQKKEYNLDENVEVWSDFLYSRFHHRTSNIVKEFQHNNNEVPFDVFPLGTSLWNTEQFEEDFSDKIRQYLEECNNFQVSIFFIIRDVSLKILIFRVFTCCLMQQMHFLVLLLGALNIYKTNMLENLFSVYPYYLHTLPLIHILTI